MYLQNKFDPNWSQEEKASFEKRRQRDKAFRVSGMSRMLMQSLFFFGLSAICVFLHVSIVVVTVSGVCGAVGRGAGAAGRHAGGGAAGGADAAPRTKHSFLSLGFRPPARPHRRPLQPHGPQDQPCHEGPVAHLTCNGNKLSNCGLTEIFMFVLFAG